MTMSQKLALAAAFGSALLLGAALAFQFLGGMSPCKMCIWQRWPHLVAVLIGVLIWFRPNPNLVWMGFLALMFTTAIGIYHAGVEQAWWPGPDSCTSGPIVDQSTDDLFDEIMNAPVARCDEIPWATLGISMAGWNAICSSLLATIWAFAARSR